MTRPLTWGRRYLMCPPDHFRAISRRNPWMDPDRPVDAARAATQWHTLVARLRQAGAHVVTLEPDPGLPDMVFTANAGLVDGTRFVPARLAHAQRRDEPTRAAAWFTAAGFTVRRPPANVVVQGLGDALPFGDALVIGRSHRSSRATADWLATTFSRRVVALGLADPRFYHVDLVFCPLDDRHALVAGDPLDRAGVAAVQRLVPEPLWLEPDEATAFVANSVVVGDTVIMPTCPPRVGRQLEAWGFAPVEVAAAAFHAAGGSVRCLTLALDTNLTLAASRPSARNPAPTPAV